MAIITTTALCDFDMRRLRRTLTHNKSFHNPAGLALHWRRCFWFSVVSVVTFTLHVNV